MGVSRKNGNEDDDQKEAGLVVEGEVESPKPAKSQLPSVLSPLDLYMREVGKYALLTREEEYNLALKLHDEQDIVAAHRLVTSNLRLVIKIAFGYMRSGIRIMDLIQEGNVGLMRAVKEYNPYKGVRLAHYASWWIKAYIQNYIMKNWSLVKIGTTQAQRKLFYKLEQERRKLEALGFTPEVKTLSANLGVKESEVIEMQQRMRASDLSVDMPLGEGAQSTFLDFYDKQELTTEDILEEQELREIILDNVEEFKTFLKDKELYIFNNRIFAEDPLTLQEIGEKFGITRERARQLEKRLIDKLRVFIKGKLPDLEIGGDLETKGLATKEQRANRKNEQERDRGL